MNSVPENMDLLKGARNENYARSFSRYELKYPLSFEQADLLLRLIHPYIKPDIFNRDDDFYRIASLYYDSPTYDCFWEKLDGLSFRRKVRIRLYNDDPDKAFLEIKQRTARTVQKRRVLCNKDLTLDYLDLSSPMDMSLGADPVFQEAENMLHRYRLQPKAIVSYDRKAYFGKYERGVRITLDRNLKYRKFYNEFRFRQNGSKSFFPSNIMILEIKFNHTVPLWLCSAMNELGLCVSRISKYCSAIDYAATNNLL